ncbi:ArsR/SmtB family transcription factor [Pseudophaeobacter sp.]|uniref:ArsR/SmtB family transcription factor n=1 Tax=Pseudophaeobacter sp. TaxID=1971739 RepID=UPI004059434C
MKPLLKTFSALADETRMAIVEQLMDHGELAAGDLVRGASITAPAISRHLKVLREAGLIAQRAEGTKRLYSARPESLQLIADWTQSRRTFWDSSLDRLEAALLEDTEPEDFE